MTTITPLDVECPFCGAPAGHSCVARRTGAPAPIHDRRVQSAHEAELAKSLSGLFSKIISALVSR